MALPQGETATSNFETDARVNEKSKTEALDLATQKLTTKIFELELLEVMIRESGVKLKMREKEVAEQKRKLEELQYRRWANMGDFCDRMWTFSAKNDLFTLFNKCLDMPKRRHCNFVAVDNQQNPEVAKLRSEVDELKKILAEKKSRALGLEETMLQANIQLRIAQNYRDSDPEIIRMKKNIDKYQKELSALEAKIAAIQDEKSRRRSRNVSNPANSIENKIPSTAIKTEIPTETKLEKRSETLLKPVAPLELQKAMIETENSRKRLQPSSIPVSAASHIKDDFVTASELIAQEEKENSRVILKKSKFCVKRESAISRKLGDARGTRKYNW